MVPEDRVAQPVLAPALPVVVELGFSPYYFYGGFHYHYHNDHWRYAPSRSGPWLELPRSHYPREIRRHGSPHDRGRGPP